MAVKRRSHPRRVGPVERAIIAQQLREILSTSRIHALVGGDSKVMVEQAGRVLFVVIGAAIAEGVHASHPDVRIIRGAVNALHEQAGVAEIDSARRSAVSSGLDACIRMLEELPYKSVVDAACDLRDKLRVQHVSLEHFQELIAKLKGKGA